MLRLQSDNFVSMPSVVGFDEGFAPAQFLLSKEPTDVPAHWREVVGHGWHVCVDPGIPLIELTVDGVKAGWLIGFPISAQGIVTGTLELQSPASGGATHDWVESQLFALTGRYVAVVMLFGEERFYLDAAGSLSAVFDAAQSVVASTPSLIPAGRHNSVNHDLVEALQVGNKRDWYPFGLTPFFSIERLVPNHYLDLRSWETGRHWPLGQIQRSQNGKKAARAIARLTAHNIRSVAKSYPLTLSLTAGRDSRLLLACARDVLGQCEFFTRGIDEMASQDIRVSKILASRFGLRHRVFEYDPASSDELDAWQSRTGFCVAGRWWKSIRAVKKLDRGRLNRPGYRGGSLV